MYGKCALVEVVAWGSALAGWRMIVSRVDEQGQPDPIPTVRDTLKLLV